MKHITQPPPQLQLQSSNPALKPSGGGRSRVICSCLTCRRRKVKCDQVHPICGACTRGTHVCTWSDQSHVPVQIGGSGRISKPVPAKSGNVYSRLERLEQLLTRAVVEQEEQKTPTTTRHSFETAREEDRQGTPSSSSQTSHGSGMVLGDGKGMLILEGGQSQFVSSLHYALLADEIQDIKALLGDKTDEEKKEIPQHSLVDLLSLGRAGAGSDLVQLLPETQEHRDMLLDLYFSHVDPVVGITHKPTLVRKFAMYNREMHPMVFAVYFSAVNALLPSVVLGKFGESKSVLLGRFQLGVEISLARENYLTTSSLEILQSFVLWLTCITVEDDMGKAWVLLAIAVRIAINQGLHQDPSLFRAGSMDVVTIELRRRLWHELCHLDFRAAECKGQEPSITEDSYTTKLPRNVDDEDLIDGASPGPTPYDKLKFTSQSFLVSLYSVVTMVRRVIHSTYRLERRMMDANLNGTSRPVLSREFQNLYEQMKSQIEETKVEIQQKTLRFCTENTPLQKNCSRVSTLMEWRCHLLFWLRLPRSFRGVALGEDLRTMVFEKSVNCIETMNEASIDPAYDNFRWHLNGLALFQALTHVLSELRNPLFDVPDRQRAISALQTRRTLEDRSRGRAWQACKNMIDRVVADYKASLEKTSQGPRSHGSPALSVSPSPRPTQPNNHIPAYLSTSDLRHNFPPQTSPSQYIHQPQPTQLQHMHMQATMLQPAPPTQQHPAPLWNTFHQPILNSNNITDEPPRKDHEDNSSLTNIDFGYWGDPFHYQTDSNMMFIGDMAFPWIE